MSVHIMVTVYYRTKYLYQPSVFIYQMHHGIHKYTVISM